MIMAPMPPALMDHRDDFNRADNTDIGTAWRPEFVNLKLVTNRVQLRTPSSGTGRQGAWETYDNSSTYNGGRLLTDNWAIETQLVSPVGSYANDNATTIGCCMQDTGANGATLIYLTVVPNSGISIYTNINASGIASPGNSTGQTGQTARQGTGGTVALPQTMRFERRMLTATVSVFTGFLSGTSVVTWTDTTSVVSSGDRTKRRAFIQCEGNNPIFPPGPFYSAAHDSFRAYDLQL